MTKNHLIIENDIVCQEKKENNNIFCGVLTLIDESTSKSLVEWRSLTITKNSEIEYPLEKKKFLSNSNKEICS